jgi:Plant transposon protein
MAWRAVYAGKEDCPSSVGSFCRLHTIHTFGTARSVSLGVIMTSISSKEVRYVDFKFAINGGLFKQLFVLADGIYPDMSRLVKTLGAPIGKEQTHYAAWQESARKDIERAFGILQRKFNFHVWPFKQLELEDIKDIVFMCILMHNWMVTVRVERTRCRSMGEYR